MKKLILSSFHSCSLDALECEGVEPDRILSFDSHIDTNLLGILEEVMSTIHDNKLLRVCIHWWWNSRTNDKSISLYRYRHSNS